MLQSGVGTGLLAVILVVAQTDPVGPATGTIRVFRGGSFSSNANYSRMAFRTGGISSDRFYLVGFRVAP